VRLARRLALAAVALFALLSLQYHARGWAVEYGRDNAASWNLYKLDRLDEAALRGPGGERRVAWLVGSSALRDSFDEALINGTLADRGSEWRVAKFGQTRGAAGLSWGMLRRLPIRAGDAVVHSVSIENMRADWLAFTKLPAWRVQLMLSPWELLAIEEWSWQTRLEELAAVPRQFYRFHEDHMGGVSRWLKAPLTGELPRRKRRSMHLRYRDVEEHRWLESARRRGAESKYNLDESLIDLSETQFNTVGLARMRAFCDERGVDLRLVDIPPRREYRDTFLTDTVRDIWTDWRAAQPDLYHFPHPPDDHYYDMNHPNGKGRAVFSMYLLGWLDDPVRGEPTR